MRFPWSLDLGVWSFSSLFPRYGFIQVQQHRREILPDSRLVVSVALAGLRQQLRYRRQLLPFARFTIRTRVPNPALIDCTRAFPGSDLGENCGRFEVCRPDTAIEFELTEPLAVFPKFLAMPVASVVPDPAELGHAVLWWRALTQWIGGMGIIVLSIAILPLMGVGAINLATAEYAGGSPDRLTPRFRETAKRLWYVYVGLTAGLVALLSLSDMTVFDAVAHAFTTVSTGGFSTSAESLAGFSAYAQWIVVLGMVVGGTSFALHFRGLRRPKAYAHSAEFRLYLTILLVGTVFVVVGRWGLGALDAVREGVFNAVSIMTATGYANADFGSWALALQLAFLGFMFLGGMTGSTTGGLKTFRLGVLGSAAKADLRHAIHPKGVFHARFGKSPVEARIVHSVQTFFLFYLAAFVVGVLLMGVITSSVGSGQGMLASVSAVASALGTVGPGLAEVGPAGNFLDVPTAGKWLLSWLMIIGRLEIFPIILLFTREMWRR